MRRNVIAALAVSAALSGCVATQQNITDLQGQMDSLQVEMNKLRQTIDSVQKNQADLVVKMDQVHTDLGQFSEQSAGFRDQMNSLSSRIDDLKTAMDANTKAQNLSAVQIQSLAQRDSAGPAQAPAASTTAATIIEGRSPSDLFKEAQSQLWKKQFDLAIEGFQLYLKNNPKGSLADQAQYAIGDAYYGLNRFGDAARAFAQVLDSYPSSELTAPSRLRYALSILKADPTKKPEAQRYLESISDDFPGTPEAAKAKQYLSDLFPKADKQ